MRKLKPSFEEIDNEIDFEKLEQSLTVPSGDDAATVSEVEAQEVDLGEPVGETTEEDIRDAAEALESFVITLENNFKEDERVADTVETLIAVKDKIETGELADKASVDLISEMATAGTEVESSNFISTESFSDSKAIALESLGQRIGDAISNIASGIKETALSILPMFRNLLTFINMHKSKLDNLNRKLKVVKNKSLKVSFELKANRYMASGKGMQASGNKDEYLKTLKTNTEVFSEINAAVVSFTKSQFLAKTKTFFSILVPGINYDKNFLELYTALNSELLVPLSKVKGLKVFQNEDGFKEYQSDPYLGGYVLSVKIPDVALPKNKDDLSYSIKNLISVVPKATASFTNTGTAQAFANYGNVKFENLTISDVDQLITDSQKLSEEASKHINFIMKWVEYYASYGVISKAITVPVHPVYTFLTQQLSGIRIVRLGAYIVQNMTSRIFQAMKGITANNIKIATVAIGAFEAADK